MRGGVSGRVRRWTRRREDWGWRDQRGGTFMSPMYRHDFYNRDRNGWQNGRTRYVAKLGEENKTHGVEVEGVQRRRRRTWEARPRYQSPDIAKANSKELKEDARITSFYISNFDDNIMAKDLLRVLACYGKIVEVVIPSKRDKIGWRFGFARYVQVDEPEHFAIVLDNVFVGGEKLFVNLPRFEQIFLQRHDGNKARRGRSIVPQFKKKKGTQEKKIWVKKGHDIIR